MQCRGQAADSLPLAPLSTALTRSPPARRRPAGLLPACARRQAAYRRGRRLRAADEPALLLHARAASAVGTPTTDPTRRGGLPGLSSAVRCLARGAASGQPVACAAAPARANIVAATMAAVRASGAAVRFGGSSRRRQRLDSGGGLSRTAHHRPDCSETVLIPLAQPGVDLRHRVYRCTCRHVTGVQYVSALPSMRRRLHTPLHSAPAP